MKRNSIRAAVAYGEINMNITNILQLLAENTTVDYINNKVKGEVPQSVLDTLSSLMKKNKYDNIAMAIIKAIQDPIDFGNKERVKKGVDFLCKRTKLVYATLKEAANKSDDFSARSVIEMFLLNLDEGNPIKYWAEYRAQEKDAKEHKKQEKKNKVEIGLKGAKPIEIEDAYLFIPHGFKMNLLNSFDVLNYNKQQEDLRKLSDEIAKKDTSGEDGANVNHWCVASSDSNYYSSRTYKGGHQGGIFIIIVLKNPDGSPNWNRRYLYWHTGEGDYETENNKKHVFSNYEFADKFDNHVGLRAVPYSVLHFIDEKIIRKLRPSGPQRQEEKMNQFIDDVKNSKEYEKATTTKKGNKRVNRSSETVKEYWKILRYIRSLYKNNVQEQSTQEGETPKALANAINAYYYNRNHSYEDGNYEITFKEYGKLIKVEIEKTKRPYLWGNFITSEEEIKDMAKGGKDEVLSVIRRKKPSLFRDILKADKPYKPLPLTKLLYDDEPNKKVKDLLHNNNLAISTLSCQSWEDNLGDDSIKEFFIGPNFYMSIGRGENSIVFTTNPWHLNDYDTTITSVRGTGDALEEVKDFCKKHEVERYFPRANQTTKTE